jgi:hypothetical protein
MSICSIVLPKKRNRGGHNRIGRKLLALDKSKRVCHYCGQKLTVRTATFDHRPSHLLLRAKFLGTEWPERFKHEGVISCGPCNHHDQINNCLGRILCSTNIAEIRSAARYLCNLVRPNKKDMERK